MEHAQNAAGASAFVLEARIGRRPLWIDASRVVEVVARVALSPLPGAPPGVRGVLDHRGHPALAIDLRERFGAEAPVRAWDPFVLVEGGAWSADDAGDPTHRARAPRWALIVDEVTSVTPRPEHARAFEDLPTERVAGIVLRGREPLAVLVDPARLLDERELAALRDAFARRAVDEAAS